jgi:hypothetical protein
VTSEPPMRTDDYLSADEGASECLLTFEGAPDARLSKDSDAALAALAAVVHSTAPRLSAEQLERAVWWLKRWKTSKQDVPSRAWHEFSLTVDRNRELPEQRALQRQAYYLSWASRLACLAAGALGAIAAGALLTDAGSTGAAALFGALAVAALVVSEMAQVRSTNVSKEQEQRNLWTSIRQARTVGELNTAGLFAYLPGTMRVPGQPFNERVSTLATKAEAERLADALYRDPDGFQACRSD